MTWREFVIFNNTENLVRHAAGLFVDEAAAAIEQYGKFSVALSGGTTPGPLYSSLATAEYRTRINWNQVHFFWTDERCVPPDHPDSNFRLAFDLLISKLRIPDANIHRIFGEMKADKAAEIYEKDLLHYFHGISPPRFDLIFLGVGSDGHTASLFPDMEKDEFISRSVVPVHVSNVFSHRVTLTPPVLNNARRIIFLVVGKKKSEIVRDILERNNNSYPAARIRPTQGISTWLLDHEAARLLASVHAN